MRSAPMSLPPSFADVGHLPVGAGERSERGAVALITVIVLMAAGLAIVTSMNLLSVSESSTASFHVRGNRAFYGDDACVEETLLRLYRDPNYLGGTLAVGPVTCTVTVTLGTDPLRDRNLQVVSTEGPLTRRVTASANIGSTVISGRSIGTLTLTSWQEVP